MHTAQRAPVLLALQRTHGNRYVQRVVVGIQAKLKVGQPGDVYEQEADRVAEQVMRMPEPPLQRQAEEEEKKKEEEEEELIQSKENSSWTVDVTSGVESHIDSLRGSGQPLSESVRNYFEPRFGYDFSGVRIHTGEKASEAAKAVNSRAFTLGNNIIFNRENYSPDTEGGKKLLAHELAHVVQQSIPVIRRANSSKLLTWTAWLWSGDGVEYNKLRTRLEEAGYKFITHVKNEEGKWEKKFPTSTTPANQIGWSIGTPEGKWKWATTANVVAMCRTLVPSKVLKDFAAKFSDAADLIRKSPDAMKLVIEAEKAGVKFGGYAETGPAKDVWPYTSGKTVYVPKAHTDKVIAMSDFLFELNNAIRRPKFAEVEKEAAKGAKGKLTAKQYAYKKVEIEVEGMLRMGEIWFKMKKTIGKGAAWNKYDNDFYLSEYKAFKAGKKSKDDIVKDVLTRKYTAGKDKGKTVEQFYIDDQYKSLSGTK
jgi:hypothetical protein